MDLSAIIDHIAGQADEFLDGFTGRADARAGISEYITLYYVHLSHEDRTKVIDGVTAVLEKEGFFNGTSSESGGSGWKEGDDSNDE